MVCLRPTRSSFQFRLLPTRSSFSPYPALAEFSTCLPCGPTDTVSTGPEPALRLPLSSAPARSQIWRSGQAPVYLAPRTYGHCRKSRTGLREARLPRMHVVERSATEFIELYASTTPMHSSHCNTSHPYTSTGCTCTHSISAIAVEHLLLS